MSLDNLTALRARDDLLTVVAAWPVLQAWLRPQGGKGEVRMAPESGPPLDVYVSDLMREVEESARFYGQVLMDEAHDFTPPTSTMPGLLKAVAHRYGHFTADSDDKVALDFCDVAHELRRKVAGLLNQAPPPRWVGPCPNCEGELRQRPGDLDAKCRECGYLMGSAEWQNMMHEAFEARLMTWREIKSALFVTRHEVPDETVKTWIKRRQLVAVHVDPDLFHFKDAWTLAERRAARGGRQVSA